MCPTSYDPRYLEAIPREVLERDYGCGNPSKHLNPGEVVLDLGSGSGKICFIASQVVGSRGRVIGIDMNDDMLALSRQSAPLVAQRTGYANVSFKKGRIQDLALDLEELDACLRTRPIQSTDDLTRLEREIARIKQDKPLVPNDTVDVVVSNCVLNLVRPEDKRQLFSEIFRVLRRGGRAVISEHHHSRARQDRSAAIRARLKAQTTESPRLHRARALPKPANLEAVADAEPGGTRRHSH